MRRLRNWEDHGGWQEFFDTYWKLIYAFAIKSGLSDAEAHNVVQETVVSVAKQMREDGYDRAKGSLKTRLFTITRRRILSNGGVTWSIVDDLAPTKGNADARGWSSSPTWVRRTPRSSSSLAAPVTSYS